MIKALKIIGVLLCYLAVSGISLVAGTPVPDISVAAMNVPYEVAIEGVEDRRLRRMLEAVSDAKALRKSPPASLSLLRRRAERDTRTFLKVLRSEGYYGSQARYEIDPRSDPVRLIFRVDPGPAFVLESVHILTAGEETAGGMQLPTAKAIGLVTGKRARSKRILEAEKSLIENLRSQGYPFARVSERKVVVDHARQAVGVTYRVEPGPSGRFGETVVKGLATVEEGFVRGKIPWGFGDRFDPELLEKAQDRLLSTGLFSLAQVKEEERLDEAGRLPIDITLRERKHRTIRAGVGYKTDEGPGGTVSWEHRNLFGRGERLRIAGTASAIALAAEGYFRKPEFLHADQALLLHARAAEEDTDAFDSRNLSSSLQIERLLSPEVTVRGGVAFRFSEVEQLDPEERFGLLSLPFQLDWDTSDDLLNPTRGGRLTLKLAPFYDALGADLGFVKSYAAYSRYLRLWSRPSIILAGRAALGAMAGAPRDAIPADVRFYAGGGGSIRGIPFQAASPLIGDEPIGGRSLFDLSTELRFRLTKTIGFVAFVDGGSAFAAAVPDFGEELQWGAGLGLRYFTPVGPLRLDVAVPLERREGIDDRFQVYISLGQAF